MTPTKAAVSIKYLFLLLILSLLPTYIELSNYTGLFKTDIFLNAAAQDNHFVELNTTVIHVGEHLSLGPDTVYFLNGTILIESGGTLEIHSNTTVFCSMAEPIAISSNGILYINGTSGEPVSIIGNLSFPNSSGIRSSGEVKAEFLFITGFSSAINSTGNLVLRNSLLLNNSVDIVAEGGIVENTIFNTLIRTTQNGSPLSYISVNNSMTLITAGPPEGSNVSIEGKDIHSGFHYNTSLPLYTYPPEHPQYSVVSLNLIASNMETDILYRFYPVNLTVFSAGFGPKDITLEIDSLEAEYNLVLQTESTSDDFSFIRNSTGKILSSECILSPLPIPQIRIETHTAIRPGEPIVIMLQAELEDYKETTVSFVLALGIYETYDSLLNSSKILHIE
ncbi:MAG: hypothetical protein QW728_03790, partial [Thermoplasmata archaeon]